MVTTNSRLGALAALALALTTTGVGLAQEAPPKEEPSKEEPSKEVAEEVPEEDGLGDDKTDDPAPAADGANGDEQTEEVPEQSPEGAAADVAEAVATAADDGELPAVHHAPLAVATVAEPLSFRVDVERAERVKSVLLVYRTGEGDYREVPFRWGEGGYVAVLPADLVQAPGLAYVIELELVGGRRIEVFASRAEPHEVQVPEDGMDLIEDALSERLEDRRNVFFSSGEAVSFGKSRAADAAGRETKVDDSYYRIEGGYAHRPLRTINEFSFRIGVVRGSSPVPVRPLTPGQSEDERYDVGLNYGGTSVRFRLGESWYLDGSLLASVTEVGFSAGTGMALHIGDPYGSQLQLGFEAIQEFGARFYSQVDIQAHERVRVSPVVEVTNMPSADRFGVRLLGEVGVDIGAGFAAAARGGYQARQSTSGGPSGGGTISYSF